MERSGHVSKRDHVGGVNIGLADGSAKYISNDIYTGGPNHNWGSKGEHMTVWDKLIASGDNQVIEEMPF